MHNWWSRRESYNTRRWAPQYVASAVKPYQSGLGCVGCPSMGDFSLDSNTLLLGGVAALAIYMLFIKK